MKHKGTKTRILWVTTAVMSILLLFYLTQRFWAHRSDYFIPDYPKVTLTLDSDYETIFLQTGLGRSAAETLLNNRDLQSILNAQNTFFDPPVASCTPLLGWFTREDCLETPGTPLIDLQPGDIILTLSTHSAGWRHGHAGLVIDNQTTLECIVLGTNSTLVNIEHWTSYSNYAVLRLKEVTPELQQEVVAYSLENLLDVPYHLLCGFIGPKAPDPESSNFGLHCSYLVWYAWKHLGYDLDSDSGRLVSTSDLLQSDHLEVVQVYGMDPRALKKMQGSN